MALEIRHFDPKLKRDLDIVEQRENTMAEYFHPNVKWRIAMIDPTYTKAEDLREYDGMTPQFSQGKRLVYADSDVRDLVYPLKSDGAAYGSLLFTPCREFHEMRAKVLIIDDTTGATGKTPEADIMPRDEAMKLVGDCAGKMDISFADTCLKSSRQPIQFRMGIKPQEGNEVFRIAKGTLTPADLGNLTSHVSTSRNIEYDLVLPTSAFKGRKGETAIEPGSYDLTVGLGVKVYAEYGPHRLGTQVLVNYPKGVEADILPLVEDSARHLADIQSVPYKVAEEYCRSHERRKALAEHAVEPDSTLPQEIDDILADAFGDSVTEREDPIVYQLLKKDLEHFGQILDHPLIIEELKKHVRREWQDLALGRSVSFHSGMAQPSLRLREDEVSVPFLPDGEELIVLRSPVLNSNGVVLLTNRHIPESQGLAGTIHIHPKTAAYHMQADFDGDRLAFELASKYPTLTTEIRESHRPENRYPDVVKPTKIPYQDVPFEEIALSASSDKVGIIANRIQKAIALSFETTLLPPDAKEAYVKEAAQYYRNILTKHSSEIPSLYFEEVTKLASIKGDTLSERTINDALTTLRSLERTVVGQLSIELQVAVDGFKSALRPNDQVLKECQIVSGYRSVSWIDEKSVCKRAPVEERPFLDREMKSANYSPIDLLIQKANTFWTSNPLECAPSRKYQKIFEPISPTMPGGREYLELASTILNEERSLVQKAIHLRTRLNADADLSRHTAAIHFPSDPGRGIYVTNIQHFAGLDSPIWSHPNISVIFEKSQEINATLAIATAHLANGESCDVVLGTVSKLSLKEHSDYLKTSPSIEQPKITLSSGIAEDRIKYYFEEAQRYRDIVRAETSPENRADLQRALWQSAFTKTENPYKKGRSAFTIFPEEVLGKLSEFQALRLQASGLQYDTNEHKGRIFQKELVTLEVDQVPSQSNARHRDRIIVVDGRRLGTFSADSLPLQPGTKARATITTDKPASVTLVVNDSLALKVTQVTQHAFAEKVWGGEEKRVFIAFPSELRGKAQALVDGAPLGILDKESVKAVREHRLITPQRTSFTARLESPAPTTATIEIHENTLIRPWEQDRLRMEYEKLAEFVVSHPGLHVRNQVEVDRAVAALLYSRNADPKEIQLIISQSNTLREWKRELPHEEFRDSAKNYIVGIAREAESTSRGISRPSERGMER